MFAGRVGSWERLQYRVRIENPTLSHAGARVLATLLVPFGYNEYGAPTLRADYFRLLLDYQHTVDINGNTVYRLTYTIGLGASNYTDTIDVGLGTQELVAELVEPRWYTTLDLSGNPVWEVRWHDLRIYLNGVEIAHPFGGARRVLTEDYYPASMPMGAAELVATCYPGYPDLSDYENCQDTYTVTSVTTARVVGGYRCRESGEWREFPIHYEIPPLLPDGCNTGLDALPPEIEGNTTWNASIAPLESVTIQNVYHGSVTCTCSLGDYSYSVDMLLATNTTTRHSRSGRLFILPDLPRRFVPIGDVPHEYLMYRAPLPSVNATRAVFARIVEASWQGDMQTTCLSENSQPYLLHPQRDELLYAHDGGSGNPLSDGLDEHVHSLVMWSSQSERTIVNIVCNALPCPVEWELNCPPPFFDFAIRNYTLSRVQSYMVGTQCHPYYRHTDHALRYWNTHAAPFWSYICWLQNWLLDRNGDGVAEPTPVARYWRPHQCQHIEHPALPESVRSRRRSYLLLDTLAHGTWSGWIDDLFGVPSGWVGSVRPALVEWLPPSDLQLTSASAPRWSATGATLAFTPLGVAVTPTATTHTLEFALADWDTVPYLYPAVADRVRIWLPDTAYASINIELVSAEGDSVSIATTRGTHAIPAGDDSKYAGTWRRQYAALAAGYSELGSDWDADGVSDATFGDPARATLWQLLGARAGARLRITITQTTPTPYLMEYPIFYRDSVTAAIATDNGAHTYPHVRNHQTLNWGLLVYPTASNTPSVRPTHQPMTLYDAAALYRQLQLGQDAASTAAIMAQILGWGIDDVETGGHPAGVPRVRQMCRAVMLPYKSKLALWLINDLRECPPLPTLPTRQLRLSPEFGFNGDWGQWCYFAAPSRRYYLHPGENAHLWEIEGTTETQRTVNDRTVGRYLITRHDMSVDGTETMQHPTKQWRIRVGTRTLARTTPFFSHACVSATVPTALSLAIPLAVSQLRDRLYFALQPDALEFVALPLLRQRTPRNTPRPLHALETNDRTDLPQLLIGYQYDTSVTLAILPADGTIIEVWTMDGKRILIQTWGEEYAIYAWILGQDSRVRMRVSRDHARTWTSATDCILDGAPFDADDLGDCTLDRRHRVLYLTYKRNATVAIARSTDGINWETCLT
jgi:hypothetical protein